mmetsp:Transcript_665/g.2226  ORF Transcript_665/g.2226 Transcript_665/m.2226 type:complete len:192 (-) Transcript_665:131-706(-)
MSLKVVETGPCSGSLAGREEVGSWLVGRSGFREDDDLDILEKLVKVNVSGKRRGTSAFGGIQKMSRKEQVKLRRALRQRGTAGGAACNHWLFLPRSVMTLAREMLSGAREEGCFETVSRFSMDEFGMAEIPGQGEHVCGLVLRVSTEQLNMVQARFGLSCRRVIEAQSLSESSYVVKAYAFLQPEGMDMRV